MKTKTKRLANIELLRIIAMLMVVMLHYLGKGGLLPAMSFNMDANGYVAWILESLSIVAVNVYVLISGYFLVESTFKPGKIVNLILQVLFYTILITVLAVSFGLISKADLGFYNLVLQILPFQMEQYWFMTAYLVLYILSPVLAMGVKAVSQRNLKIIVILFVAFMCVEKSLLPMQSAFDKRGYDALWFVCLFLVAAYIRLYGLKILEKPMCAMFLYIAGCVLLMAENMAFAVIYQETDKLGYLVGTPYHYNHIFNFLASVGLFMFFLKIRIKDGVFSKVICAIAPYTLGVYLLHEQIYVRYLWPVWVGTNNSQGTFMFVVSAMGAVLLVFTVGILVDYLRSLLFKLGSKLIHVKKSGGTV